MPLSPVPAPLDLFVGAFDPRGPVGQTGGAAGYVYLQSFQVRRPVTITKVRWKVKTQNGNIDVAVFDAGAVNRLASVGTTALATVSTIQEAALLASLTLRPGVRYWQGANFDGSGEIACYLGSLIAYGDEAHALEAYSSASVGLPIPATITPIFDSSGRCYVLEFS